MRVALLLAVLAACSVKPVTFTPEGELPGGAEDAGPPDAAVPVDPLDATPDPVDAPPVDAPPVDAPPVAIDAPPMTPMFDVAVDLIGTGAGRVTSSVGGLSCPGVCTISVPDGTSITLAATPAARSTFDGWGDACSGTSCTLTVHANTHVTARMTAIPQFTLAYTRVGTGSGTVRFTPPDQQCTGNCGRLYDAGTVVALSASPVGNSVFLGWGGDCSGRLDCQVTMAAGRAVSANFAVPGHFVTIEQETDHLQRLDPATGTLLDVGPLGVPFDFGDCAWDSANDTLYMVDARGAKGLYRVDLSTGAATLVGVHGIPEMFSLAYHPPSNQLYGVGFSGGAQLYRLDAATGAATLVAPLSGVGSTVDGLAWDSRRNRMVGAVAGNLTLFSVDLTTGATAQLGNAGSLNNLGMTFDAAADRFWLVDFNGKVLQLDPDTSARTDFPLAAGQHTCLALVP